MNYNFINSLFASTKLSTTHPKIHKMIRGICIMNNLFHKQCAIIWRLNCFFNSINAKLTENVSNEALYAIACNTAKIARFSTIRPLINLLSYEPTSLAATTFIAEFFGVTPEFMLNTIETKLHVPYHLQNHKNYPFFKKLYIINIVTILANCCNFMLISEGFSDSKTLYNIVASRRYKSINNHLNKLCKTGADIQKIMEDPTHLLSMEINELCNCNQGVPKSEIIELFIRGYEQRLHVYNFAKFQKKKATNYESDASIKYNGTEPKYDHCIILSTSPQEPVFIQPTIGILERYSYLSNFFPPVDVLVTHKGAGETTAFVPPPLRIKNPKVIEL